MCSEQTITTEKRQRNGQPKKCNAKQTNARTQTQLSKQFKSADRNSRPPKQQKGVKLSIKDNNTKGNLDSTYESRKKLLRVSLSITVRDIPSRTCMTASKFEKEAGDHRSSRSLRRMWPFHVVLCKERQRNEMKIVTHAYGQCTRCSCRRGLLQYHKLPEKPNIIYSISLNSQTSRKQTKAKANKRTRRLQKTSRL